MPHFRIVLWLRRGADSPLCAELCAAGYPVQRATSAADALRLCGLGPCFLFVDSDVAELIGGEVLASLFALGRKVSTRAFLLGESLPLGDPRAPLFTLTLSPRLPLASQIEELARAMQLNQRSAPRADVVMPAAFVLDDGRRAEGSVLSLSETGALFVSATPPALGARGTLLMVHESQGTLQLVVEVVNERRQERGAGVRFVADAAYTPQQHLLQRIVGAALGLGVHRARAYRIGVFDQSRLLRRTTALVLGQCGYVIDEWENPRTVLQALATPAAPHILLVDPTAPLTSGDRLGEFVKRAGARTRVVLYTNAVDEVVQRVLAAQHLHDVVRKGVFADVLCTRVAAIVGALGDRLLGDKLLGDRAERAAEGAEQHL